MNNFSSQFAPIDVAYGKFNPIANDKLQFDIISTFQNSVSEPSFSTPIIGNAGDIKKQYCGVVTITPPSYKKDDGMGIRNVLKSTTSKLVGYDYEVYKSSNTSIYSPDNAIMKGTVRDTNLNTFTFPISDVHEDYFVMVTPFVCNTKTVGYEPWKGHLEMYTGISVPDLDMMDKISNRQVMLEPNTSPVTREETIESTQKIFKIFYTTRVLQERKRKIESHKKSKEIMEKIRNTPVCTPIKFNNIIEQREEDLKNVRAYQKQFRREIPKFNTVPDNHGYTDTRRAWEDATPTSMLNDDYKKVMFDFVNVFEKPSEQDENNEQKEISKKYFDDIAPILIDKAVEISGKEIDSDLKDKVLVSLKAKFSEIYEAVKDLDLDLNLDTPNLVKLLKTPPFNSENLVTAIRSHELNNTAKISKSDKNSTTPIRLQSVNPEISASPWLQSNDLGPDLHERLEKTETSALDLLKKYNYVPVSERPKPTFKKISCDLEQSCPTKQFSKKESSDAMEELDAILKQLETSETVEFIEEPEHTPVHKYIIPDSLFQHHLESEEDDDDSLDWSTITDDSDSGNDEV